MSADRARHLYGYPVVGRFGLGHSMLAWARCVVWCHDVGAEAIAPQWLQPRLGPYLRRERDKRFYHTLFQPGDQIGGAHRLWLLASADRLSVETERPQPGFTPDRPTLVIFRNRDHQNEKTYFHEIDRRSALVRDALTRMTKPRFRPTQTHEPHIALHVRGGDFSVAKSTEEIKSGRHNVRLPLEWYIEMLDALRGRLGANHQAIVYSDCTDTDLAPLLSRPAVSRSTTTEAITDMLAMSQASLLISSGSGFSRWGSYLGQVPRISFPGQRTIRTLGPVGDVDLEPECESAAELTTSFLNIAAERLGADARVG